MYGPPKLQESGSSARIVIGRGGPWVAVQYVVKNVALPFDDLRLKNGIKLARIGLATDSLRSSPALDCLMYPLWLRGILGLPADSPQCVRDCKSKSPSVI
ncbi:uncharacterized protein LOC144145764 isoform X2 [Haemaphysalis longicornis]